MISTGIENLDSLISGFKLGDNVVWEVADGAPVQYFIKSFFDNNETHKNRIIYISVNSSPFTVRKRYDYIFNNFEVLLVDAFTHGKGNSDPVFLDFYSRGDMGKNEVICIEKPKDIQSFTKVLNEIEIKNQDGSFYIFDSLTGMSELWKDETLVLDFFTFTCPKLYDLNTLAYWIFERDAHSKEFIASLTHTTQIVFSLSASHSDLFKLTIKKLEDRPSFRDSEPHYFKVKNDAVLFQEKKSDIQIKIGKRVKEQRISLRMTQADLASQLEMTPGAVSQIENEITVPSLQTLVQLSLVFHKPIDYFIGGTLTGMDRRFTKFENPRNLPAVYDGISIMRLMDSDDLSIQPFLIQIESGISVEGSLMLHKGEEFITVIRGTVSVSIDGVENHLEENESILIKTAFIEKWHNIGPETAQLMYILL